MSEPVDNRKLKRSLCYLDVYEVGTGEILGNVNDIHHEGLRLISRTEIPLFEELTVNVKTPLGDDSIQLVIKGIWNKLHEEPAHYNTGCQIVNPSTLVIDSISKMIESLKKHTYYRSPLKSSTPAVTH